MRAGKFLQRAETEKKSCEAAVVARDGFELPMHASVEEKKRGGMAPPQIRHGRSSTFDR